VLESCTICSSSSRRPVRKLLDTTLYMCVCQLKSCGRHFLTSSLSSHSKECYAG